MAYIGDMLKSNFLSGSELSTTPQIVTVKSAEVKELGENNDKETKVVLEFYELAKALPLNKTRLKAMADAFGLDTNLWINQKVMIYSQQLSSGKFAGQWTITLTKAPQAAPVYQQVQPPQVQTGQVQPVYQAAPVQSPPVQPQAAPGPYTQFEAEQVFPIQTGPTEQI